MKISPSIYIALCFPIAVHCDWIASYKEFATLQYWFGDDNSGFLFNPLRSLGGNGQWFPGISSLVPPKGCHEGFMLISLPGPDVYGLGTDPPAGCTVDQAIFVSRHGSRYPDKGAYNEWIALYDKVRDVYLPHRSPC